MTKRDEDPETGEEEGEPKADEEADESAEAEPAADTPDVDAAEAETDESSADKIPLSELRDEVTESGSGSGSGSDEPATRDDPASDSDTKEATEDADSSVDIPLSELRSDVVDGEGSPASESELFFEERVDEVDSEAVWADLLMGSGDTDAVFDATAIETELEREYQIVPKTLCHRCEYFGDPPTLHCTHDGTTIHETVDMDHYRVSKCPMVRSDREPGEE